MRVPSKDTRSHSVGAGENLPLPFILNMQQAVHFMRPENYEAPADHVSPTLHRSQKSHICMLITLFSAELIAVHLVKLTGDFGAICCTYLSHNIMDMGFDCAFAHAKF
jgi:hypothetical protein